MKFLKRETLWSTVALLVISASYVIGWVTGRAAMDTPQPAQMAAMANITPAAAVVEEPVVEAEPRISPLTKMVYEYYYEDDGVIETAEENAPAFLLARTRGELAEMFGGWAVVAFAPEEVVLRKTLSGGSGQRYIVGEHEGYVAVYYETAINGGLLKEVTDTPLAALPETERERLKQGILVVGADNLAKVMEDYGS